MPRCVQLHPFGTKGMTTPKSEEMTPNSAEARSNQINCNPGPIYGTLIGEGGLGPVEPMQCAAAVHNRWVSTESTRNSGGRRR